MREEVAPPTRHAGVQRVASAADLARIRFVDGMAAVEMPYPLLRLVQFKNDHREDSPRLRALLRAIRREGYRPVEPIICRIGQKGRWVVVDGGHRLTAARKVDGEVWTNLFGRKVRDLYFLLFETPRSGAKLKPKAAKAAQAGAGTEPGTETGAGAGAAAGAAAGAGAVSADAPPAAPDAPPSRG